MISKFIMPYEDEYFLGWLMRLAYLNSFTTLADFLKDLTGYEWRLSKSRISSISSLMSYILSYFGDISEFDIMKLIHSSTLYDFYRHFWDNDKLDAYLNLASSIDKHDVYPIHNADWINYCDHCDMGYFRTCNQLPYLNRCPRCGRKLSHFSYNHKGKFELSNVNHDQRYDVSDLISSIFFSKSYFSWRDIREILKVKYIEVLVGNHFTGLNHNQFPWLLEENKGLAIHICDYYDNDYFRKDSAYENDTSILYALLLINALFNDFDEFAKFGMNIGHVFNMPIIHNSGLRGHGTIDSNEDLYKIHCSYGGKIVTDLTGIEG